MYGLCNFALTTVVLVVYEYIAKKHPRFNYNKYCAWPTWLTCCNFFEFFWLIILVFLPGENYDMRICSKAYYPVATNFMAWFVVIFVVTLFPLIIVEVFFVHR